MKTLVTVRDGDWEKTAQVFGPALRNVKNGRYVLTMTPEFTAIYERGMQFCYGGFLDDILPISSAIVKRLVRRTLTHDVRPMESIAHFLDEVGYAKGQTPENRKRSTRKAVVDMHDAADYLECVFGIGFTETSDGRPAIAEYRRDKNDRRLWARGGRSGTVAALAR